MAKEYALTSETGRVAFDERIIEKQLGNCRLLMLPVEVDNVIAWQGSFLSNPDFAAREELLQSFLVSLLDKGSEKRDKFELAEVLENKGARIQFHQRGVRTGFSGQSLRNDFRDVFSIQVEQLLMPGLVEDEIEKARMRIVASIRRNMDYTSSRAGLALRQLIYPESHPNYSFSVEDELAAITEFNRVDLQQYHKTHYGANECTLVVVGDIDEDEIVATVEAELGNWESTNMALPERYGEKEGGVQSVHVAMQDKFNLDVKMGHKIDIRRRDADFLPLYLGNFILGGNFSSRLMDIVRDEMGLTYGVHSSLVGVSSFYGGHWNIGITLSQDKLEEGIEATRNVVTEFVEKGVTEKEVEDKKATIKGTYQVQLDTTRGLASVILTGLERGFGKDRLDTFAADIDRITVEDVNRVLKTYLKPSNLHQVSAGTKPADT